MQSWCKAALFLATGCAGAKAVTLGTSKPTPVPTVPAATSAGARYEYVPVEAKVEPGLRDFGAKERVLVDGVRFAPDEPTATDAPVNPLVGGVQLPDYLGQGYLFWNTEAFYRSDSFTGPLRPAGRVPGELARVRFGNSCLLLHLTNGGRVAWSLKEQGVIPLPYPSLIDVVSLSDGRSALLTEPNTLWLHGAGQRGYLRVTEPNLIVSYLGVLDGEIGIQTVSGHEYQVTPNGALALVESRSRSQVSPESLRTAAFDRGILLDDDWALVVRGGVLTKVDPRTGQTSTAVTSSLLKTDSAGPELVQTARDIVAIGYSERALRVVKGLSAFAPVLDRSFRERHSGRGFYVGNSGSIAVLGPCEDATDSKTPALCIRDEDGQWREHRLPASFPSLALAPEVPSWVARWVPVGKGAVLGFIAGSEPGLYDTRTGTITRYARDADLEGLELFGKRFWDRSAIELPDGTIAAYTEHGPRHWARDGRALGVASSSNWPSMEGLQFHGANAIGISNERLWQSTDSGRTWRAIRFPPHVTRIEATRCSAVGCVIGGWYRLGYPAVSVESPQLVTPPRPALEPKSDDSWRTPQLTCQLGKLISATKPAQRTASDDAWQTQAPLDLPQSEPIKTNLRELAKLVDSKAARPLEFQQSLPLLAAPGAKPAGALLVSSDERNYHGFWLGNGRKPRHYPNVGTGILSAAVTNDGRLVVLEADGSVHRLRELNGSTLLTVVVPSPSQPAQLDRVALGPSGEVGLLRLWPRYSPNEDDPAWLFRSDQPPIALAPWSTLSAGPCGTMGYRVMLDVSKWLHVSLDGDHEKNDSGGLALVTWGTHKVCLEALEFTHLDEPVTNAVVSFGSPSSGYATAANDQQKIVHELACRLHVPP